MSEEIKLKLHLASGTVVEVWCAVEDEGHEDALLSLLADDITSEPKPHWHMIENVLVFTGALSAVEVC